MDIPMTETASEVAGRTSDNWSMKTDMERRIVTPSVSFSPDSGGSVNPSNVMDEMRQQGMMRLNP